jgi:putative ABC transport system substrate-binding protein
MNATPQTTRRRIGVLEMASPDPTRLILWDVFKHRLRELGYAEGTDIVFEFRWAEGRQDRLTGAADELVHSNIDVLVTAGTPAAAAASRATADIPIVMATGVGIGTQLTDGVHKPNPNMTGISDLPPGVSEQRLQLLRTVVHTAAPLAILADHANPSSPLAVRETQSAARSLQMAVRDYWVTGPDQIGDALRAMEKDGISGFVVAPGAMFFAQRHGLAGLARELRLAVMSVRREYAEAGCLMAYGAPIRENYRQAALYVSRILGGTKPAELPVDQPTEFDFVINLATAQAIGLVIPESLLVQAEAIES